MFTIMKNFVALVTLAVMSVAAFANPGISKMSPVYHNYTVCVYAPEGFEPAFVGADNNAFTNTSMIPNIDAKGNLYFYAQFKAIEGSQIRFVANADQKSEIKEYDTCNQCWKDLSSVVLTSDSVQVFNYSDSRNYAWSSILENFQNVEAALQASRTAPVANRPEDMFVMKYGRAYTVDGREIR